MMHLPKLPPKASKIIYKKMYHGIYREDPYHWLRASNWQDVLKNPSCLDENIRRHLEEENAYQTSQMADTKTLQNLLFAEMKNRIQENDSSVPIKRGPFAYGLCYKTGGEQPHYFRTPRNGGKKTFTLMVTFWLKVKIILILAQSMYLPIIHMLRGAMMIRVLNFIQLKFAALKHYLITQIQS